MTSKRVYITAMSKPAQAPKPAAPSVPDAPPPEPAKKPAAKPVEIGGPKGPEPTRYGDWEVGGRVSDF